MLFLAQSPLWALDSHIFVRVSQGRFLIVFCAEGRPAVSKTFVFALKHYRVNANLVYGCMYTHVYGTSFGTLLHRVN